MDLNTRPTSQPSRPVDALLVLDAEIARERRSERSAEERGASFGVIDPIRIRIAKLMEARDAMAALIQAASASADRMQHLCDTRLRGKECAEVREEYQHLHAAVARVGGRK